MFLKKKWKMLVLVGVLLCGFLGIVKSMLAADAELAVTQITAVRAYAVADGTYSNGWSWTFNVTVPNNETSIRMKFNDWVDGSKIIAAGGHVRFYSAQSLNAADADHAISVGSTDSYGGTMTIDPDLDLGALTDGRQIQIRVEVAVPIGSEGGDYTTSYGIESRALVINTAAISGITVPVTGASPVTTIADTTEYTATIGWSGSPTTFVPTTVYTATITLTPKVGYTLTGVGADFFTVTGGTATNAINSGVVTVTFPATGLGQLTIGDPALALSKIYDGTTDVGITAVGTLSGVFGTDDVGVSAVATYDTAGVGTSKTITVVYTLSGTDAAKYIKPIDYTVNTGEIISLGTQTTPTFDPIEGAIASGTTVAMTSTGADNIYFTNNGDTPTISSTRYTAPITISSFPITLKALAVKAGYDNSAVGSVTYTQAAATVPSSIVLAVGTSNPVGGVTNVQIPAAGGTDSTGAVSGWVTGSADEIRFTVTDGGSASSTITINGSDYVSGSDYVIPSASDLTVVVTTTESGKITGVRTFTITVSP
jgi:hypothetical protein